MSSELAINENTGDTWILVTGGTGYIGSHTVLDLLERGHKVIVFDNLCNSSEEPLERIEKISGKRADFIRGDLRNQQDLEAVFSRYPISSVIHFAGLKAVGESVKKPIEYYDNNVYGSLNLLKAMRKYGVNSLIYSSSATVYGDPSIIPIPEHCPVGPMSPYGKSKLHVEEMLKDICNADAEFNATILRYFNPAGAHPSGIMGEDPSGIPNNLMPFIAQVVVGHLPHVNVFGTDYNTPDGTGIRDYIHVCDLSMGHVAALKGIKGSSLRIFNLGTGRGYSVLEMIEAMRKATGHSIPAKLVDRRPGDVAILCADPRLANDKLDWKAEKGLNEMCQDLWRWKSLNPHGYQSNK